MMAACKIDSVNPDHSHVDGRKPISVDRVLNWAYKFELPSLHEEEGGNLAWGPQPASMHPMWKGGRVDCGNRGWDMLNRYPPHPDAILVHKAVQRLKQPGWLDVDAELHGLLSSGYEPLSSSATFEHALARVETILVNNARRGSHPKLMDDPSPYALRAGNGEVIVRRMGEFFQKTCAGKEIAYRDQEQYRDGTMSGIVELNRGKPTRGKYPEGSFCLVEYYPSWDNIMDARAEYMVWWCALTWLQDNLELERYRVTELDLPCRPWWDGEIEEAD